MGQLRSLQRAMDRKAASNKPPEKSQDGISVQVDGDTPPFAPSVGDVLIVSWGDPNLIDGQLVELPMILTSLLQGGRVCGQIVTDPQLVGMGPGGQQQRLPVTIPVVNIPFSATPRAMTWRLRPTDEAIWRLLAAMAQAQAQVEPNEPTANGTGLAAVGGPTSHQTESTTH